MIDKFAKRNSCGYCFRRFGKFPFTLAKEFCKKTVHKFLGFFAKFGNFKNFQMLLVTILLKFILNFQLHCKVGGPLLFREIIKKHFSEKAMVWFVTFQQTFAKIHSLILPMFFHAKPPFVKIYRKLLRRLFSLSWTKRFLFPLRKVIWST